MKRFDARRSALRAGLAALGAFAGVHAPRRAWANGFYPDVVRGVPLRFPRDHGAHPAYRTEWWYLTGWLRRLDGARQGAPGGVQITFFRTRTRHDPADPSSFAPVQLLFAHAALALPERGSLLSAQRAAREGLGLAWARAADTGVAIGDWSLVRQVRSARDDADAGRGDTYRARIADAAFAIDLSFRAARPPVLQGDQGFSRKGPIETQASYYYSRPQLGVEGTIEVAGASTRVDGLAWLDHEWSSEILDAQAVGWDWVGLNFDDGSAWMAFRIRRHDGETLWSDARQIDPAQASRVTGGASSAGLHLEPPAVRFEPLREWTSPRSGVRYPVAMRLTIGARRFDLEPLFDDQELDTRETTGVLYWEGAVRVVESATTVGRGYLELTGYAARVRM